MPSMRSPAQRAPGRQVEYATQDDVRVLAAEIRGLRESMEAEIRGLRESMEAELRAQRESVDARFEKIQGLLESQQELIKVLLEGQVQSAARFDRQDARLDSLLKWGLGGLVAIMVGFGGLIVRLTTGDG